MTKIINIAIIAHVDHGKTTLVDQLFRQSGTFRENQRVEERAMDSGDLEKERGITILAKNCAIDYTDRKGKKFHINIIDTPGHADFGSEVERVLKMVDSVLLLVDAYEWPMPQTKFVLKKSLELWLKPIVVINKIDKDTARPTRVINQLFDLFFALWATDAQADFPIIYCSAKGGYAFDDMKDFEEAREHGNIFPIFELIEREVKPAADFSDKPFRMQVANLWYDDFIGRLGIWRVYEWTVKQGEEVVVFDNSWAKRKWKITKIFTTLWLSRVETKEARCGDIVTIAGIPNIFVGETIGVEWCEPFPPIKVDAPTLTMDFLVNDSPFAGREWKLVTSKNIQERLHKELQTNVGLEIDFEKSGPGQRSGWGNRFAVSGRGELHLSVLIETMRREGFEIQVSAPQVIFKEENGEKTEPIEQVIINVDEKLSGAVIDMVANKKWQMVNMNTVNGITTLEFEVPTRGLLWFRGQFVLMTKGEGIMYSSFSHYAPYKGDIPKRANGSMISLENGKCMKYSIRKLQERGKIFILPQAAMYEWMIVGESAKPGDMSVNLTKNKQQTNVRESWNDEAMRLEPIIPLTLEDSLAYISTDEYVEITPKNIRLRKIYLTDSDRKRAEKIF